MTRRSSQIAWGLLRAMAHGRLVQCTLDAGEVVEGRIVSRSHGEPPPHWRTAEDPSTVYADVRLAGGEVRRVWVIEVDQLVLPKDAR